MTASAESARVLTWNVERKRPDSPLGSAGVELLFSYEPDVMALTEVRTSFPVRHGHALWCEPPRGRPLPRTNAELLLWSREPWRDVDRIGTEGLDQTRFVSATTDTAIGPLRVIGVCIPWHTAEVTYPIDVKRKPWELHIRFLELLPEVLAASDLPTVVAGDFNQQVPRVKYGNRAAAEAMAAAFADFDVITAGQLNGGERPGIDHIAVSSHLAASKTWAWPNVIDGQRLSDHEGAGTDLQWLLHVADS